jgi:serine/threonine protein phosphatase 1
MNVLVVADVHGCYRTVKRLVELHWETGEEFLVFAGDLVNKGRRSAKVVEYVRGLQAEFPYHVFVVKGNHELMFEESILDGKIFPVVEKSKKDFVKREVSMRKTAEWMRNLPLKWETPYLLVTHAGVAATARDPYNAFSSRGVLHNRSPLRSVGKLQLFGHVVQLTGKPTFFAAPRAWGIDTGCWRGGGLSALRIGYEGSVMQVIQEPTDPTDL